MGARLLRYCGLLFWAIIFYLFLFQPIVSKYYYIGIELLLYLCFVFIHPRVQSEFIHEYCIELQFAFFICLYSLLVDFFHWNIVYSDRLIACFFQGYFISFLIYYYLKKKGRLHDLNSILTIVCVIACSITITAILVPSVEQFVLSHATQDVKELFIERYQLGGYEHYRSYGLSESLNFTYAYVLSIIAVALLSTKFHWYTFPIVMMVFIAIIFNARIAFIPLLVFVVYFFLFKARTYGSAIWLFIFVICAIPLWNLTLSLFPSLNNSWGLSFFTELFDLLSGKDSGTVGTLVKDMFVFPDSGYDWVFGTGKSIYMGTRHHSDVGYILQLNYGGIVLLILVLMYFIYTSRRVFKKCSIHSWFSWIFLVSVFVLNFKGFYLSAIPGSRFLSFLYIYHISSLRYGN